MRAVYLIPGVLFSLLAAGICACADGDPQPQATAISPAGINTSVFVCDTAGRDSFEFTIRLGPGELALWLPWEFQQPYLVLAERYAEGAGDYVEGDVMIRLRGNEADLVVGESSFPSCRRHAERSAWEHAKLSGVDFRATGSDPEWTLEIRNQQEIELHIAADGVALRAVAEDPEQQGDLGIYRARTGDGMLEVQIGGDHCVVAEVNGTTVAVYLDGAMYSGCGRALH